MTHASISPTTGDMYRCANCGLEIHVVKGCDGDEPTTVLACCGQPMEKITEPSVQNP